MELSFQIIKKDKIAPNGFLFRIKAPEVAIHARPGQFFVLRVNEQGERIPLTLVRWNRKSGTIDFAFQVIGKTTHLLSKLKEGDFLKDVLGPLGRPSEIKYHGTVALLAGGFGAAAMLPIATTLKEAGNNLVTVLGARSKDYLVLEKELKKLSSKIYVMTDDGSYGIKGFVKDGLEMASREYEIAHAYVIGPAIMMKFTVASCQELGIPNTVSLNPIMVDATGMCGSCRVNVGGKTYFACVDGPEFDGSQVDWNLLLNRLSAYVNEEKHSYELFLKKKGALLIGKEKKT